MIAIPTLIFLYDVPGDKVLFYSHQLPEFFEGIDNWKPDPPFFNVSGSEWQRCLALKEGQTTNFFISVQNSRHETILFNFDAFAPQWPSSVNPHPLLCTITRSMPAAQVVAREEASKEYQERYAEFLGIASHDLDAPLRKLSMLIERLNEKFIHDRGIEADEYVRRIQSCLGDMRSLVDGLTDLSERENGITLEACDLGEICLSILEELQAANSRSFEWELGLLPSINGNRALLRQLFRQLLTNAVLFQPMGTTVRVRITEETIMQSEVAEFRLMPEQEFKKIVVADNGIGFSAIYATRIFDPFVRLNGKSDYPGGGIGLSLCKKIARLHHGFIYAEGNVNNGARFTLILPQSINQSIN